MDNHFYSSAELPNGCYEVEKMKQKIFLDLSINLGVFILNYAKFCMLKFYYDCVDEYLSREDFKCSEYSEMDTDLAYMAIFGDSFEALIKPKLIKRPKMTSTTGLSPEECLKGNICSDFSRLNLRETKSLAFASSPIVLKNFQQIQLQARSSSA